MSKRDAKLLLIDISEACNKIFLYIENLGFKEFNADDRTSDAVIRNLEVIGELRIICRSHS
jgi:uncharacterized protein with HEPN domain